MSGKITGIVSRGKALVNVKIWCTVWSFDDFWVFTVLDIL